MSFSGSIRAFKDKTVPEQLDKVYRAAMFNLSSAIIIGTPVKKGVLRSGWFLSIDRTSDELTGGDGVTLSQTLASLKTKLSDVHITNTVFLVNNYPYGPRIEFEGWSAQAPAGMVRVNTVNWDLIVDAAARALNER